MATVSCELTQIDGIPVLRIAGEMRLEIDDAERALNRLSAGRPPLVVLDLSDLTFISSLGMGLLNGFRRGLHTHGGITRIAGPRPDVAKALILCGLDKLFEIHPTLPSATQKPAPV